MNLDQRLRALDTLRSECLNPSEWMKAVMIRASKENAWFDLASIRKSLQAIGEKLLAPAALELMVNTYAIDDSIKSRAVGLVMAGNIPLVGFHDWLCVFLCGHQAAVKLSQKDPYLLKGLLDAARRQIPGLDFKTNFVDKLVDYDAIIATGSNNTHRYFQHYFSHVPHILRKNRTSVAVLKGKESDEQLLSLGRDVLEYYGLGCRNVSKIYWPKGFQRERVFELWRAFKEVKDNPKYCNNYDYNFGMWGLNRVPFFTNDILLFKEDSSFQARIASVHFEEYENLDQVRSDLLTARVDLQCVVAENLDLGTENIPFGESQKPGILDYADGVDTMQFLLSI